MADRRGPISTWEKAEVSRSSVEASLTSDPQLRISRKTLQRYAAPAADTSYPLEYACHLLGDVAGKTILDLGCGSGAKSMLLTGRGATIVGIDISVDLIRLARRRMAIHGTSREACFAVGSAHDLPVLDAAVDVVFGIAILHHLDLERVSREVHRVLRPGGRAIFQEPVRNSRLVRFVRWLVPRRDVRISPFERPLTTADLSSFASRFECAHIRAFGLPHVRLAKRVRKDGDVLARAYQSDGSLLRRWPRLSHWAAVRVVEFTKSAAPSRSLAS
jgi:SAM-dependent methyltransferase